MAAYNNSTTHLDTSDGAVSLNNSFAPEAFIASDVLPEVVVPKQDAHPSGAYMFSPAHEYTAPEKRKRILGLPVAWFWAVIGIIVVAFCVALGVGLGVGLSSNDSNDDDDSSTSVEGTVRTTASEAPPSVATSTMSDSPSSTSSAPVSSGTSGIAENSCTFTSPRTYNSDSGSQFLQYCFADWPRGVTAADGDGTVQDVGGALAYTFEDCMDACAAYNEDLDDDGGKKCAGVTYNANLTSVFDKEKDENCFFKDRKGEDRQGSGEVASAALVG